jgi:hypothetical protein
MKSYVMTQKKNQKGQTSYEVSAPGIGVFRSPYCNDPKVAYDIASAAAKQIAETGKLPSIGLIGVLGPQ